jgi:hypothetical protein
LPAGLISQDWKLREVISSKAGLEAEVDILIERDEGYFFKNSRKHLPGNLELKANYQKN